MSNSCSRIAENLARVQQRLAAAAERSGRAAADVTLVAVTKYVDMDAAATLLELGCRDLGESRPQELWHKAEALAHTNAVWHLIGHLQRNKVRRTMPLVSLLHSCDSLRLTEELQRVAVDLDRQVDLLLEVNVSGDPAKHGFAPTEMAAAIDALPKYPRLKVRGLMAMAGVEGDLQAARRDFERLRRLRDDLSRNLPPGVTLDELSMGMSADFEIAIEEGATIVRVGSALFEGLALIED